MSSKSRAKKHSKSHSPQKTQRPQEQFFYYFVVTGEIEYQTEDGALYHMTVNGVHAEPIQKGKPDGITVKGLAQIQTMLQMHFHTKYSKTHPRPPEITDVTILGISHLGVFTREQFHRDEPPGLVSEKPPTAVDSAPPAGGEPKPELPGGPSSPEPTLPEAEFAPSLPGEPDPAPAAG